MKSSADFQTLQLVVRTKEKIAKHEGKGNLPHRAEVLSPDDEEKLWATTQMGAHSPIALLRALWWLTGKLMGNYLRWFIQSLLLNRYDKPSKYTVYQSDSALNLYSSVHVLLFFIFPFILLWRIPFISLIYLIIVWILFSYNYTT